MDKVDPKAQSPLYTARRGVVDTVTVPVATYLMIDGAGDPNTAVVYREAVEALYATAYALKFRSKRELGRDYVVPPLEALWWADDLRAFTSARDKDLWSWTVMILVPDWLSPADAEAARGGVEGRPATALLRIAELDEGLCVQTLHIGPYDDEGPVLADLHDRAIPEAGFVPRGKHHEIYLGDPRRAAPEKLRTILRQPVEAARH